MTRLASILLLCLCASAAAQNMALLGSAMMGSVPQAAQFPTNDLAIRFRVNDLAATNGLLAFPGWGPFSGIVATNLSTAPDVTNSPYGGVALARRAFDGAPWSMGWPGGVALTTNMTFAWVGTRASGQVTATFGRKAATSAPYGMYINNVNQWGFHSKVFWTSNITGRILFIAHIEGTNLTIDVNGVVPPSQSYTFSAGTIDQIGRVATTLLHANEAVDWAIWTNKQSAAKVAQLRAFCHANYGTPP